MTASLGADTPPLEGLDAPAIIFSIVDFPAPFLPIRAILSVGLMEKEMSLNRACPPWMTEILSTEIMSVLFQPQRYNEMF